MPDSISDAPAFATSLEYSKKSAKSLLVIALSERLPPKEALTYSLFVFGWTVESDAITTSSLPSIKP